MILDEVELYLAYKDVRGENDDDAKAKCIYFEAVFKKDTSPRFWIGCDGPCKLLPHQTWIPKHQRPRHMHITDKWMCDDSKVEI